MSTYITKETWQRQYQDICNALEPWILAAPTDLLDDYLNLRDLGCNEGWL